MTFSALATLAGLVNEDVYMIPACRAYMPANRKVMPVFRKVKQHLVATGIFPYRTVLHGDEVAVISADSLTHPARTAFGDPFRRINLLP